MDNEHLKFAKTDDGTDEDNNNMNVGRNLRDNIVPLQNRFCPPTSIKN